MSDQRIKELTAELVELLRQQAKPCETSTYRSVCVDLKNVEAEVEITVWFYHPGTDLEIPIAEVARRLEESK